jgi:hypothetical protein
MAGSPIEEVLKSWKNGETSFSPVEYALKNTPKGHLFGSNTLQLLGKCTVCPKNSPCTASFEITIHGICPPNSASISEDIVIHVCTIGCNYQNCQTK